MATQIQFRRGTASAHSVFTGAIGEVTYDTTLNTIRVHNSAQMGGFALATRDFVTSSIVSGASFGDGLTSTSGQIVIDNTIARVSALGSYSVTLSGGITSQSLSQKLGEIISVKDFGALGDNSTDDSDAIQAALSFVSARNGGQLFIPNGNYFISKKLTYKGNNLNLTGESRGVSKIITSYNSGNVIELGDGAKTYVNNQISNLTISSISARTAGVSLYCQNQFKFLVHNISFDRPHTAMHFKQCTLGTIKDFEAQTPTATSGMGIIVSGGNDQYFRDGIIAGTPLDKYGVGFLIRNTGATWVDNVGCLLGTNGMALQPVSGNSIEWLFVTNCAWDSGLGRGLVVEPLGGTVKGCSFTLCWTSSFDLEGIYVNCSAGSVDGLRFSQHRSFNNGRAGVSVLKGTNFRFHDGEITGNSRESFGIYHGVEFAPGVSGMSIQGCRIGSGNGFPATQGYNLLINNGDSNNYILTGNDLRGFLIAAFSDGGSGPNKIAANNIS